MNKYNFSELRDRRKSGCVKWDDVYYDDLIPLWVADMDFPAAPCIQEAIQKRMEHGVYGYVHEMESYFESVQQWFKKRHNWTISREAIQPVCGLVQALNALCRSLMKEGEGLITQAPLYNGFFPSIDNNNIVLRSNPLIYQDHKYTVDWDNLEESASLPDSKIMLVCNPHNPSGRIWTREELQHFADIAIRHDLILVSDEIHCEVTPLGMMYTPMALIDGIQDRLITMTSPGKGFNIAGLGIGNIITENRQLRERVSQALWRNFVPEVTAFGVVALEAAYREGEEWLNAVNEYIGENYRFLKDYISNNIPRLGVTRLEGTYLTWLDHRAYSFSSEEVFERLLNEKHVRVSAGTLYGKEGEGFMRVNIACPRCQLEEGLRRMKDFFTSLD